MGLSKFKEVGDNATVLMDVAQGMRIVLNNYKSRYEETVAGVKSAFGAEKVLSDLTDEEINAYFLRDMADAATVDDARMILEGWEASIEVLDQKVGTLPPNDA